MTLTDSQRALAGLLGISHQRVGRYLREGEEMPEDSDGNYKLDRHGRPAKFGKIPDYLGEQIDYLFEQHKQIVKEQARIDKLPYLAKAPIFQERKYMRNGNKGDRVISGNTEFIRQELRETFVDQVVKTGKFYKINVRSRINLKKYSERLAGELIESGKRRGISARALSTAILNAFVKETNADRNTLIDKTEPFSLFTRSTQAYTTHGPWQTTAELAKENIEDQLRNKHSPATGDPGTRYAYEYLLQARPAKDTNGRDVKPASNRKKAPARKRVAGTRRHRIDPEG